MALTALSLACFASFARNRTLHCGLTGPWFLLAAVAVFLLDRGYWSIDPAAVWVIIASGVAIAFLIEWRLCARHARGDDD